MSKPQADKKTRKPKSGKATVRESSVAALFDGALAASREGRHDAAIETLTAILQRDPKHARARHLLGAEYAQTGKINEAIIEMAVALELEPTMALARFQLGLLLLTSSKRDQAAAVWAPLDTLGAEHVLNLFKIGMLQMADGDFAACRASLTTAVAENTVLPILNDELATALRALDQAESAQATQEAGEPQTIENEADQEAPSGADSHILVSTYAGTTTTH